MYENLSVSVEANPVIYTVEEGNDAVLTLVRSGAIQNTDTVITLTPTSGSAAGKFLFILSATGLSCLPFS